MWGQTNPADAAMPYLNQAQEMYKPYVEQGQNAYGQLNPAYSQMINDPGAYLQNLMQGYQQSKGYQLNRDEALRGASATAAAGGRRGTPQDMENQAKIADILSGQDMQQWLQNVMGLNKQGLQGQQHFYDTGVGATSDIANILNSKGSLAFQGQANKNKSLDDLISGLLSAAGTVGGAAFGGPVGGAAGGAAGKWLGGLFGNDGYTGDMNMFGSMPASGTPSYGKFF